MSIQGFEQLEAMKAEYLKYSFESAQTDLSNGDIVNGEDFLKNL